MPHGSNDGISVAVNDKIFVTDPQQGFLQRYSPDTDTWEIMLKVSDTSSIAAIKNKIYFMGGFTNEEYDPATNTISARTQMPTPRSRPAAGVVNNKIYAIGGLNDYAISSANEEYSPPATYYIHRKD